VAAAVDGEAATVAVVVVAAAEAVAAVADEIFTEPAGFPQCRCAGFGWFRSAGPVTQWVVFD